MKERTRQTARIFIQHSLRYKWSVFFIAAGIIAGSVADSLIPLGYKKIVDILATGGSVSPDQAMPYVWIIFGLGSFEWVSWRVATYTNNFFQPRVMSDLLNTCFQYLQNHSYGFFSNSFTGSLVKKVTRYGRAFEDISDQFLWSLGPVIVRIVTIFIVLYQRLWILSLVLLIWSLVYMIFNYRFILYKLPYDIRSAASDTKTGAHLADSITNNINLKLFGGNEREYQTHRKLTQEMFITRKISWDLSSTIEAGQAGLMVVLELVVLTLAVKYWQSGILTIGDFAMIQGYLLQIFGRLWDFGRNIRRIFERMADAEEMTEILVQPHEIVDQQNAPTLKVNSGKIEFRQVSFTYQQPSKVFDDFNLTVLPGERIALIGPSGGGKSTIVKLLLRFHDIESGQILIDGQNIAQVTQASLRHSVSVVPQDPILFHRTLLENIRYARPDASEDEVVAAAKLAHAHEFISAFPHKYETFVGERGIKLSGGERQRVAIARAILKNSPILVLDEATSSLDSESEMFIQDALKSLMSGRTTIVIAHRLSTIMQMDRIIVLEGGRITEEGKHKELLKAKKGTYQKLWQIQAGGFV